MPPQEDNLTIDRRFRGPPTSGNGGYVCGLAARHIAGDTAEVRLRIPPPLDRSLHVERLERGGVVLVDGTEVVAQARPAELALDLPKPPPLRTAEVAAAEFRGFVEHWYPDCFVCGPERGPGDGLRVFPGPVFDSDAIAAPWTPDASLADANGRVGDEFLWAALDCPGAFTFETVPGKRILLGSLTARILRSVRVDEACVVVGWHLGDEGRKRLAGTAVFSGDELLGFAKATWIEIVEPPA